MYETSIIDMDARIAAFVASIGEEGVFSTSAKVVQQSGPLYNVDGSDDDPKIKPYSWKGLLESKGIGGDCYVVFAKQDSHPQFNVGGHVTPNANGGVDEGGVCYLMPLCHWHNNKARDGTAFALRDETMLELSGYMKGELALTFIARMSTDFPISLIYEADNCWYTQPIDEAQYEGRKLLHLEHRIEPGLPARLIVLRRFEGNNGIRFALEKVQL